MHKHSFTLVEILLSMAIIGVVAVLTIPSITEAYQKKVLTTQLQRAYAAISQAVQMVIADEGETDDFRTTDAITELTFLGKYLPVKGGNGFAEIYNTYYDEDMEYDLKGEAMGRNDNSDYFKCGVTEFGAGICINRDGIGILDINGKKGPNMIGRDAYRISFTAQGQLRSYGYGKPLEHIRDSGWNLDKPD
ncbi:type II secretion system protein [bacterium]|nr:type II secretion system protein [bacterium]